MTYNPEQPLVTDTPQISAPFIQVNFAQFAAIFSKLIGGVNYNHMPMNDENQGKHAAMIFENQILDPGVEGDLTVLYSKDAASHASTEPQLFAQIPKFLPTDLDTTNAPNDPMQLTYNSVNTAGPMYYTFLPGGYIVYFGMVIATALIPYTITLSPVPSEVISIFAFPQTVDLTSAHQPLKISVFNNQPAPGSFNVYTIFPAGINFYDFSWMAIAKA
jgi:hypothetical protein